MVRALPSPNLLTGRFLISSVHSRAHSFVNKTRTRPPADLTQSDDTIVVDSCLSSDTQTHTSQNGDVWGTRPIRLAGQIADCVVGEASAWEEEVRSSNVSLEARTISHPLIRKKRE